MMSASIIERNNKILIICILLVSLCLLSYSRVNDHDFINYDDREYVTDNRHVISGLTRENISWAFGFSELSYWHPLTWISLMLDAHLFWLNPKGYHLTNVIFHILNTLLLFLCFNRMTGELWKSATIAALFAVHPLNVESVAWITERKNVLSTFFLMLSILGYSYYVKRPTILYYGAIFSCFTMALLAKPTASILPGILLLLDYWPLHRFKSRNSNRSGPLTTEVAYGPGSNVLRLLAEKIPLAALSALSVYVSTLSTQQSNIVVTLASRPMGLRIQNALDSYLTYLEKLFIPTGLSIFYPYPTRVPFWSYAAAGLTLCAITIIVVHQIRKRPFLAVGWFWYVGTLIPTVGLIQVGLWPAHADRFVYVPLIGLFIMASWGLGALWERAGLKRNQLAIILFIVLLALMGTTRKQTGHWQNSETLFRHAIKINPDNSVAHMNLGTILAETGRQEEAVIHFQKALPDYPRISHVFYNLGLAYGALGFSKRAESHFLEALSIEPAYSPPRISLSALLIRQDRLVEAARHLRKVLKNQPESPEVHNNLGVVLFRMGERKKAIEHYRTALMFDPMYQKARMNLKHALHAKGDRNHQ